MRSFWRKTMGPSWNSRPSGRSWGKVLGAAALTPMTGKMMRSPPQNRPRFWRIKETPMAEMRGARRGALRSRR